MSTNSRTNRIFGSASLLGLGLLLVGLIVACGSPTAPTDSGEPAASGSAAPAPEVAKPEALAIPATQAPAQESVGSAAPAASSGSGSQPAPTAMVQPTPAPQEPAISAKDEVIIITNEEPTTIGAASANCGGNIQNTVCDDMVSDPLTWIDDLNGYQVVGLTGIEGWEQLEPDRWRFNLREGVTFHNGAPWNATQAKFWIDYFGDEETSGHHNSNDFSFHGVISGEVVDDYTLDVVCGNPCPILPRTTIFTKFQDVGWFEQASEDDIERFTRGPGPVQDRGVAVRRGSGVGS